MARGLRLQGQEWPHAGANRTGLKESRKMKTYHILLGNCEDLLNDSIEALFQEVCQGKTAVQCARAARAGDLVRQACETEFDLVVQVPHNLLPAVCEPTPIGLIAAAIWSIQTIKSRGPVPVIAIVAPEERSKYEPLLLGTGADCVLAQWFING